MTIKGLTDRGVDFPMIGSIRKGDKGGKNGSPRDLDYFLVKFDDENKDAADKFTAAYGISPRKINIYLPFDSINRMWQAHVEAYLAGGLVYRGDGDRASHWIDPMTGEFKVKDGMPMTQCVGPDGIVGQYVNDKGKKLNLTAKAVGRLKVIVPELRRFAYVMVNTTSKWDVMSISSQLEALQQINNGRLAGIPMILCRKPKMVSTPLNGRRVRLKKWLISIEADPQWVDAMLGAMKRAALPDGGPVLSLPAATTVIEHSEPGIPRNAPPVEEDRFDVTEADFTEPDEAAEDEDTEAEVIEEEEEEHKAKLAAVSADVADKWRKWAEKFAESHPYWKKDSKVDYYHLRASVCKAGFAVVTSGNFDQVVSEMNVRAKAEEDK